MNASVGILRPTRFDKFAEISAIEVLDPGVPPHIVIICPHCNTICNVILKRSIRYKRHNGFFFHCGTLYCGFERKITPAMLKTVREQIR